MFVKDNTEEKNRELCVSENFEKCRVDSDDYKCNIFARFFAGFLVKAGDMVYGVNPSYSKFRAIEVVARVPYHSWSSALYTLLTVFYHDEKKAIEYSKLKQYARLAGDNETMHVVVISHLSARQHKPNFIIYNVIPILFAFIYFWISYILYIVHRKTSLEINYLFESHAFSQYDLFIKRNHHTLQEKSVDSEFLRLYGRDPANQYDFFLSVRNDEMMHRCESLRQIRDIR